MICCFFDEIGVFSVSISAASFGAPLNPPCQGDLCFLYLVVVDFLAI